LVLYTTATSSRLQYVINFIESVINLQVIVTTDKDYFVSSDDIKINYSREAFSINCYHIYPDSLLFEKNINSKEIKITKCRTLACFFAHEEDNHGFDVFGAIFYLLSRYEEYLPHIKDSYGRYAHINSIAFKNNFLTIPLVNYWIEDFKIQLSTFYDIVILNKKFFQFIPTYDIDIAYAYQNQPIIKNVGGLFKHLLKGEVNNVIVRTQVFCGIQKDPFDTYAWLDMLHKKYNHNPIYFFLLAKRKSVYDKNIAPTNNAMKQLIQQTSQIYKTGIHPSWQSGDNLNLLQAEIDNFSKITNQNCTISRQHYIRLTLPETYNNLIKMGVTKDYSMGYGSINGFRASVALPFYWYNLIEEKATTLLIHPFCYMDANSIFEQHFTAEEALNELKEYYSLTKNIHGQLITIFHNHFLTQQKQYKPWRDMYEMYLDENANR